MIGRARAIALAGLSGHVVDVEAHLAAALPAFTIVGLPDASLQESRDRVRAAVASSGLEWPVRRITVNLSPASLPKTGSGTDLAIAVAVLAAAGQVDAKRASRAVYLGELGLDGAVRSVRGVLPAVAAAVAAGLPHVVVPAANGAEARLVEGARVTAVASLGELAQLLGNEHAIPAPASGGVAMVTPAAAAPIGDLSDVRGQEGARSALEVAAAGGHHLLMVGPPGAGKTMLANRMTGLLPDLSVEDAVTVTSVHSLCGTFDPQGGLMSRPPFEAPHHSASAPAIVGGGSMLARPGAISRAHAGVLLLDEAPEFPARVLDTLRQPLESGEIVLHRAHGAARYPARFQLVLAANPCPCGNKGVRGMECTCSPLQQRRYFARLSGPLLDRIDIRIDVAPVRRGATEGETTADVAARVESARAAARARLIGTGWSLNSQVSPRWLRAHTPGKALEQGQRTLDTGEISARGFDRALRVAWSIADLKGAKGPDVGDVLQALSLRNRSGQ
ncbi:YifB family Mg chelatase-like AAA ATPase [Demequina sp.]|uniref:YifB family Mg chelatase-like AAA ATPase n=1 Tax=Demequina sp. TaxID=2050685 RepID=UPI003D0C0E3E